MVHMKGMRNDHPTNQRVGMKRSGIRPLQLLDGMHGRVLTLFVVEVLQPAFFSEALFLRVPVPCQKGADITHPPSVSFCLTRRRSEGANEERDGREHSTPPLAMSFPPPPFSLCLSWSICRRGGSHGSLDQSNHCLEQPWQDEGEEESLRWSADKKKRG